MYIADIHIHSPFSRATSREMTPESLSKYARQKGINLLGTGDITHPEWSNKLKRLLKEKGNGLFEYNGVDFILSGELSLIYKKYGRGRRIHIVLCFPDFEKVQKTARFISLYGNLEQDGRPMISLDAENLVQGVMEISEDIMLIPAHIWTPWYSLFGSQSGFDSVEECFGSYAKSITALETGLSSDPPMNWRLKELDSYALVSNSDAHSPHRLGREANVFKNPVSYAQLKKILEDKDKEIFLRTIEFYPEEGKYHYDGHRRCGVLLHPEESRKNGNLCPVCGKYLTIGVLHRVENLSSRDKKQKPENAIPYVSMVPLREIIGEALEKGPETNTVTNMYNKLISTFGNEITLLMETSADELEKEVHPLIAQGILNTRQGKVEKIPGYDGVYGKIKVLPDKKEEEDNLSLF